MSVAAYKAANVGRIFLSRGVSLDITLPFPVEFSLAGKVATLTLRRNHTLPTPVFQVSSAGASGDIVVSGQEVRIAIGADTISDLDGVTRYASVRESLSGVDFGITVGVIGSPNASYIVQGRFEYDDTEGVIQDSSLCDLSITFADGLILPVTFSSVLSVEGGEGLVDSVAGLSSDVDGDDLKQALALDQVDNTADDDKPISEATHLALLGKAASSALSGHVSDQSNPHSVNAGDVGLDNVDNTADADKAISEATQLALAEKVDGTALATVATTGKYLDLIERPTLGSAATQNVEAFASAAQGNTADNALQPGANVSQLVNDAGYTDDLTGAEIKVAYEAEANTNAFTDSLLAKLGAIDAAHYGSPLQGIADLTALPESGIVDKERRYVEDEISDYFYDTTAVSGDEAPYDQTGGTGFWRKVAVGGETSASIKTKYEANADTNAFTDSHHSKLGDIEDSADVTDAANVAAAGALMESEVTNIAQVKAFDSSDYATAAQGTDARTPTNHAGSHTYGSDVIRDATNALKGLATATQITALEAATQAISNLAIGTDVQAFSQILDDIAAITGQSTSDVISWDGANWIATASSGGGSELRTSALAAIALTDDNNGKTLYTTSGSDVTITVPSTLPDGFTLTVIQGGDGRVTFVAGAGATLDGYLATLSSGGRYSRASIVWTAAATYHLTFSGDHIRSDTSTTTGASSITNVVSLSQTNYDAIMTPDAATLYVIV